MGDADDLRNLTTRLREIAAAASEPEFAEPLERLRAAAVAIGASWSGSPIGYHARVYYNNFQPPPPGARFSSEWGFMEAFSNYTAGDWQEHAYEDVVDLIQGRAGNPDLARVRQLADEARRALEEAKAEMASVITAANKSLDDSLLAELQRAAENVVAGREDQYRHAVLPSGQVMSRDMAALTAGVVVAPHFAVIAKVAALQSPFEACSELAALAQRAATHLGRLTSGRSSATSEAGTSVVIGHGRSLLWRELKDFVHERLGLPWDEFNRVPVAGITNIARLSTMLDEAALALLILTAEDEMADGTLNPRQNVIHEVGLFQGRLGFTRAIVLLEEGCSEFSNIEGLGQIRFPNGNISAAFEDVRLVLEREGLLEPT